MSESAMQNDVQQKLLDSIRKRDVKGTISALEQGADLLFDNETPLNEAIRINNDYAFNILIDRCNIAELSIHPLRTAVAVGNVPAFKKIIPYADPFEMCNILPIAAEHGRQQMFELVKDRLATFHHWYISNDIDLSDAVGNAARHAAGNGHPELLQHILSLLGEERVHDLGYFTSSSSQDSLLMYAVRGKNPECIETVLRRNGQKKQFIECVEETCKNGDDQTLDILLKQSHNASSVFVRSFHLAKENCRKTLIQHEITKNVTDGKLNHSNDEVWMRQILIISLENGYTPAIDMLEPFIDLQKCRKQFINTSPKAISILDGYMLERSHTLEQQPGRKNTGL